MSRPNLSRRRLLQLAALAPLLAAPGVELLELQVRRASLEDVFLQLTRE